MSNMLPTVPNHTDGRFFAFCDFLRSQSVRPARGMIPDKYDRHLDVVLVAVDPQPNSLISYCWYNCVEQTLKKGGTVIFGWLLWEYPDRYFAQHHAVWMDEDGRFVDPTPNAISATEVLFMPDNRAPFDIEGLRAPASLEWKPSGKFEWLAGPLKMEHFFIAQMEVAPEEVEIVERTRQRLSERHRLLSVLEISGANILYNRLMASFDDIAGLGSIQTTKEFKVLTQLNEVLHSIPRPHLANVNSDWEILVSAWNKLHEEAKVLGQKHEALLEEMMDIFQIKSPSTLVLLGSLVNHDVRIIKKFGTEKHNALQDLISRTNEIIRNFKIELLQYGSVDALQEFFDETHAFDKRDVRFHSIEVAGPVAYLDTNAVTNLLKQKGGRALCLESVASGKVSFVSSSYLVVDAVNMNPFFLQEYLDDLLTLTQGQMVGVIDQQHRFVKENIRATLARATLLKDATAAGENHRFIKALENFHEYPELRKGRALSHALIEEGAIFFAKNEKQDIPGYASLRNKFYLSKYASSFVETGKVKEFESCELRDVISELLDVLDFANYETESVRLSNYKKIASSYRDNEHIGHACIADYFVTDDLKMQARGKFVYQVTGVSTQVIGVKDFLKKLAELG